MNRQQRLSLWIGVVAFSFLTLRPPTIEVYARLMDSGTTHYETPIGTRWVWDARASDLYTYTRVDFQRLILEWLVVGVVTGALLCTFLNRPDWHPRSMSLLGWIRSISLWHHRPRRGANLGRSSG
jgi:hypothetical protein